MFKRIVVGVDGREGGRDALALAAALQRAAGSTLVAVHVYPHDRVVPLADVAAVEAVLHEDLLATLEKELRAANVSARAIVHSDPAPARALHEVAEREDADLIVVGSGHRAGADRVLAGDVATSTLHGAPCAVAVAPHGYATRRRELRLIGVGYDGSREAREALRMACDLAERADAYVRATTVVRPAKARRRGEELPEAAVAQFSERVTHEVVVGKSGEMLASSSGDLDLLVVGSRAHGPVRRVLLGSTSTRMFREASCPVLVVPRSASTQSQNDAAVAATDARR
jgi:nucleotide-binding universal stress UspA family protein